MRLPTWTPVFLAPIVALLAFIAIAQFSTRADEARQAQIAFSQLEAQAYRMSALDWQAIAVRGLEDEMLEERREIRVRVQDGLRSAQALDTEEGVAVASLMTSYGVALDATLELVSQQRFVEAETFDEEVLDPAFARLSAQLGKANEAEAAEADWASLRAALGTGASIGVATLLLLLLFWRFHHDRRTLLQARADELYEQALHDSLTGLPNRRKLMGDLEETLEEGRPTEPQRFVMFDLDGFKSYNDTFGHPEGDLLLRRLARRFAAAVEGRGTAYRLGGDEFCALIPLTTDSADQVLRDCCEALAEEGDAFTVLTSFGTVSVPSEATTASDALRLADQRMYSSKASGRLSARQQTRDLVLKILAEQQPALRDHVQGVAALARAVGERFDLDQGRLDELERAAELHDVGKIAIPSSILTKTAPLDDEEWRFIRRHTILGETMLRAAPALASMGRLVRSSHERFDGTGYPDALLGEEIPLESRIVFVCDAYDAMTSDRSYRPPMDKRSALDELRRHAGTQFDPAVVEAFCDVLAATRAPRVGPLPAAA